MVPANEIVTVVHARLGSTRLPRKVLANIAGAPMVDHVMHRARGIGYPVVLAIPNSDTALLTGRDWPHHLGDETNVLRRFTEAAHGYRHAIRVTADCPLVDPYYARLTVQQHLENDNDLTWDQAEGRGVQVFKTSALRRALEHIDFMHGPPVRWIEHPDRLIWETGPPDFQTETMKFSVDTEDELERMRRWLSPN